MEQFQHSRTNAVDSVVCLHPHHHTLSCWAAAPKCDETAYTRPRRTTKSNNNNQLSKSSQKAFTVTETDFTRSWFSFAEINSLLSYLMSKLFTWRRRHSYENIYILHAHQTQLYCVLFSYFAFEICTCLARCVSTPVHALNVIVSFE